MQDNKSTLPKGKLEKEYGDGVMFCTCESLCCVQSCACLDVLCSHACHRCSICFVQQLRCLDCCCADSLLIAGSKRPSKKDQRQAYDAEVRYLSTLLMF